MHVRVWNAPRTGDRRVPWSRAAALPRQPVQAKCTKMLCASNTHAPRRLAGLARPPQRGRDRVRGMPKGPQKARRSGPPLEFQAGTLLKSSSLSGARTTPLPRDPAAVVALPRGTGFPEMDPQKRSSPPQTPSRVWPPRACAAGEATFELHSECWATEPTTGARGGWPRARPHLVYRADKPPQLQAAPAPLSPIPPRNRQLARINPRGNRGG